MVVALGILVGMVLGPPLLLPSVVKVRGSINLQGSETPKWCWPERLQTTATTRYTRLWYMSSNVFARKVEDGNK